MSRFKYYSLNDLSLKASLDRVEFLLIDVKFSEEKDLLDVLEYYNVYKLVESIKSVEPMHEIIDEVKLKTLLKSISKYFNLKTKQDVINDFNSFASDFSGDCEGDRELISYFDDYLSCFEKYKLNKKIDDSDFEILCSIESIPIHFYLRTGYFAQIYPTQLKSRFLSKEKNFELLLLNFTDRENKYKFPQEISKDEYSELCIRYINSEDSNINYIKLLVHGIKGISVFFDLTHNISAMAEKKYKEEKDRISDTDSVIRFSNTIEVYTDYTEYINSNTLFKSLIDLEWLRQNNDKYSLLSFCRSFKYLFIDQSIIGLCSFPNSEMSIIERSLGVGTNNYYKCGSLFSNKNCLILYTIDLYQNILKQEFDLSIEKLLEYFFW